MCAALSHKGAWLPGNILSYNKTKNQSWRATKGKMHDICIMQLSGYGNDSSRAALQSIMLHTACYACFSNPTSKTLSGIVESQVSALTFSLRMPLMAVTHRPKVQAIFSAK